jgi:glycosyltransferase involved in cell wall biosynthesis
MVSQVSVADLLRSPKSWELVISCYSQQMPQASFLDYFWTWRSLVGGLFTVIKSEMPPARIYHSISTGYAGLALAKAKLETGRPAVLTEHGIYTNERRIEILMADWISDSVERGLVVDQKSRDLRDVWIQAFESYARICYACCEEITTLYAANQMLQEELGAGREKMRVIPNGVDPAPFSALARAGSQHRPTMAFIGRVAPIKDVKTFIAAASLVRAEISNVQALVIGPTDEDEPYFVECKALVDSLGLTDTVTFTGPADIRQYLPRVHVVVLTSLSEAQPLVVLEAGAAGLPCVTTDVGSCREMLEGQTDEAQTAPGGIVTELGAIDQVAAAVTRLLRDHELARTMGDNLRRRVLDSYQSEDAIAAYREMYSGLQTESREVI